MIFCPSLESNPRFKNKKYGSVEYYNAKFDLQEETGKKRILEKDIVIRIMEIRKQQELEEKLLKDKENTKELVGEDKKIIDWKDIKNSVSLQLIDYKAALKNNDTKLANKLFNDIYPQLETYIEKISYIYFKKINSKIKRLKGLYINDFIQDNLGQMIFSINTWEPNKADTRNIYAYLECMVKNRWFNYIKIAKNDYFETADVKHVNFDNDSEVNMMEQELKDSIYYYNYDEFSNIEIDYSTIEFVKTLKEKDKALFGYLLIPYKTGFKYTYKDIAMFLDISEITVKRNAPKLIQLYKQYLINNNVVTFKDK